MRNEITDIDDKSVSKLELATKDTIDVSSIFLSVKYQIDKADTAKSNKLLREQREFLVQYNLPVDGVEEIKNAAKYNYISLSREYKKNVKKLKNHPFKDLYRQVCSQILIKRICSIKSNKESILQSEVPKLKFFLGEMIDSEGVNIQLIYASCLKLQYSNLAPRLCQDYKDWLAYSEKRFAIHKAEVKVMQAEIRFNSDELDNFILTDQKKRLEIEREYVDKIEVITDRSCSNE